MRPSQFVACLVILFLYACATTNAVKEAEGQGVKRTYEASYVAVFDATLAVAKRNELEVVESNRIGGRLVFSHYGLLLGERIAVFFKPTTVDTTEVEVVSNAMGIGAQDWPKILLDGIGEELKRKK